MSLNPAEIEAAAEALFEAEKERRQIGLLTGTYPDMDMEDAYAIQARLVQRKLDSGRKIVGWKIGLTSKAMQQALNIEIPDSGVLFDDMLFPNAAQIPTDRFIETRIEAEIAFVMKSDLAGTPDREAVLAATDYVAPSLEILDTRIVRREPETGVLRKVTDTIADNAANAGLVLGTKRFKAEDVDLRWVGAIVSRNGEVEETGLGAGVLNDPLLSMAWLAERLTTYDQSIRAGDIVLSGSFIRPVEARPGDAFHADFGSFGTVSCQF